MSEKYLSQKSQYSILDKTPSFISFLTELLPCQLAPRRAYTLDSRFVWPSSHSGTDQSHVFLDAESLNVSQKSVIMGLGWWKRNHESFITKAAVERVEPEDDSE